MTKKRRIYYVPGMISLIFLPIICVLYLNKSNYVERVIEIQLPSKYNPKHNGRNSIVFDTTVLSLPNNRRIYSSIELDSNHQENKEKLKLFNYTVDKLISTKDTVNGIHLRFGNGLKYNEFFEAINKCYFKDTINNFIIYDNNLWYFHKNVSTQEKMRIIHYKEKMIEERNEFEKNRIIERTIELSNESISKRLIDALKVWPCLIAFFILGLISIRSMTKK